MNIIKNNKKHAIHENCFNIAFVAPQTVQMEFEMITLEAKMRLCLSESRKNATLQGMRAEDMTLRPGHSARGDSNQRFMVSAPFTRLFP